MSKIDTAIDIVKNVQAIYVNSYQFCRTTIERRRDMAPGDHVKIFLPGESPWATVVAVHEDGRMAVKIDNHLVGDLHGYKYGDVVTVEQEITPDWTIWKLADLDRQLPMTG